jgi:hypothetical protein
VYTFFFAGSLYINLGYGLDDRGIGVLLPAKDTQHTQLVLGAVSPQVKRPGREAVPK